MMGSSLHVCARATVLGALACAAPANVAREPEPPPQAPASTPEPRELVLQAAPQTTAPAPVPLDSSMSCLAPADPEMDRESAWSQGLGQRFGRELSKLARCGAELAPGTRANVTLRFVYGKQGELLSHHIVSSPPDACGAARCIADALQSVRAPDLVIDRGAYDLALLLEPGAAPERTADEQAGLAPDDAATDPRSCVDPEVAKLSRAKVDEVVSGSFDQLKACYARALVRDHAATGQVTFEFGIGRDGGVEWALARAATLYDCSAIECMLGHFRALQFPAPVGRSVRVIYPIRFSVEQPPVQLR